jgi:RNA polymerase sigma-70 factor (ECF subfamily)
MIEEVAPGVMADERAARYLRLVRDLGPAVRRLAFTYERDDGRRQDLEQDIWLALWQALPRFRGECSERTFVFRLAHNRGVSHAQRWRIRKTEELEASEPVDAGADPERTLADRQRREQLQRAIRQLPLGPRQAIALALEGLSHREIGEVLGITEGNVAVRLTRARAALAGALRADGER